LRARFQLPIIAMEPALKPAVGLTRSGVIGVLATSQTLASDKFETLRGRFDGSARVLVQPCPGLVERIEAGETAARGLPGPWNAAPTRALLASVDYVMPARRRAPLPSPRNAAPTPWCSAAPTIPREILLRQPSQSNKNLIQ
jgi:hypothetical protein